MSAQAYSAVPSSSQVDVSRAAPVQRRSSKGHDDDSAEDTVHAEHIPTTTSPDGVQPAAKVDGREPPVRKESAVAKLVRAVSANLATNLEHKPLAEPPNAIEGLKMIITGSWLNLLLVCIPVSWALHFVWSSPTDTQDAIIFTFSFLAIIPLAALLSFATDELSLRVGQTLAGLLNATLGNAVELIVAIIALAKCELQVVQSSLVGSILSNILLVLGMCYFAGGLRFPQQSLGVSASVSMNPTLLMVIVIAGLFPACFHIFAGDLIEDHAEGVMILSISHGIALILLIIYLGYLIFQLVSHKDLYSDETILPSGKYSAETKRSVKKWVMWLPRARRQAKLQAERDKSAEGQMEAQSIHTDLSEGPEQPKLSLIMTTGLLITVTVFVAVTAEFLVSSIDGLADTGKISKEFIGMILLPIVGNAAEHYTAITASMNDKGVLAVSVAVGSSIQIALFVIPFIVTLGWIIGSSLTFLFDPAESAALFLSVLAVNYTMGDGESNWLEGLVLMGLYAIIALFFWYYPGVDVAGSLVQC